MTSHPAAGSGPIEEITIRRAETVADYRACQEVQRHAWGITEEGYVVPIATMAGANLHGGLVLGAFLPGGEAVALSFAFLGRIEGRLCLYSQLTGVMPGYQSRGLGYRIKMRQREIARAEGIGCIAWAFDPLQAGNAQFNLGRLGATAGRYIDNMYGERTDALNAGVPTDRLIAEWDTADVPSRPIPADAATTVRRIFPAHGETGPDPEVVPACVAMRAGDAYLLLEIPSDIAHLRRERPDVAGRWRAAVRQAFRDAFAFGYRAFAFVSDETATPRRVFYVLERPGGDNASPEVVRPV
jgi:predicted GNAT superfamily acetyltransferase